jgi:hypothetical protein
MRSSSRLSNITGIEGACRGSDTTFAAELPSFWPSAASSMPEILRRPRCHIHKDQCVPGSGILQALLKFAAVSG